MTRLSPADAPFRKDKRTPEDGYRDGYRTGLTWAETYRPGGPHISKKGFSPDPDWIAYCERSLRIHEEWHRGFAEGLRKQGREL